MTWRLLDRYCGGGGCSVGYHRAGFDVEGIDIEPHPAYPFPLTVADALTVPIPDDVQVVHSSPPCQPFTPARRLAIAQGHDTVKPDLLEPERAILREWADRTGGVYIIENVPEAALIDPVILCGQAMGLPRLRRHRAFESNVPLMSPGCACSSRRPVGLYGRMGDAIPSGGTTAVSIEEARDAMGIDWMRHSSDTQEWNDLKEAVPPAYTEYLGGQINDVLALL